MKIFFFMIAFVFLFGCRKTESKSTEMEILNLIVDAVRLHDPSKLHDIAIGKGRHNTENFDKILAIAYGATLDQYEFASLSEAAYKWPEMVGWVEGTDSDDKILYLRWHKISEFGTKMDIEQFFIIGFDDGRYNIKIP